MIPAEPWAHGRLQPGPTLLCAGVGSGWWWPRCPAVSDGQRVWVITGSRAHVLPVPEVEQVGRDEHGIIAIGGKRWARLGRTLTLGQCLKERPVPGGPELVWRDEEYVYRSSAGRTRALEVLGPGEGLSVGPHGAMAAGDVGWSRAAPPGRTPRPLPLPLAPSPLRWSSDGRRLAGVELGGEPVVIDLETGAVRKAPGLPASCDTFWVGDALMRASHEVFSPITEATCARYGDWLAGPGGALWSLVDGRRASRRGAVLLGVTVGTPTGFVTVDWGTGRGHHLGWHGEISAPFTVPLDEDDLVEAGAWMDGAVHLQTALGERFRVAEGQLSRGGNALDPVETQETALSPAGELQVSGTAHVSGRQWAWNDDGWLWSWREEAIGD